MNQTLTVLIGTACLIAGFINGYIIGKGIGRAREREEFLGAEIADLCEYRLPPAPLPDERMVGPGRFRSHGGAAMALLLAAGCAWPEPAAAQQGPQSPCLKRAELVEQLGQKYNEAPSNLGLTLRGTLIEIWQTPPDSATDTWTLVESMPNGMACIRSVGRFWEAIEIHPIDDPVSFAP